MQYTQSFISQSQQKIFDVVMNEVNSSVLDGTLEKLLIKYGINSNDEDCYYIDTNKHKILVLGALSGKISDFQSAAKKLNISLKQIEFQTDYNALKRFNVAKLEYSLEYSDIIFGPNPHKQVNLGDSNSLLSKIENNPSSYPNLITSIANNALKITISNFQDAIKQTRLYSQKNT